MKKTQQHNLKVGDKVEICIPDDNPLYTTVWFPKRGIKLTGTVQKLFKNGKVAVAMHQMRNNSEDGCHTMHFAGSDKIIKLVKIEEIVGAPNL